MVVLHDGHQLLPVARVPDELEPLQQRTVPRDGAQELGLDGSVRKRDVHRELAQVRTIRESLERVRGDDAVLQVDLLQRLAVRLDDLADVSVDEGVVEVSVDLGVSRVAHVQHVLPRSAYVAVRSESAKPPPVLRPEGIGDHARDSRVATVQQFRVVSRALHRDVVVDGARTAVLSRIMQLAARIKIAFGNGVEEDKLDVRRRVEPLPERSEARRIDEVEIGDADLDFLQMLLEGLPNRVEHRLALLVHAPPQLVLPHTQDPPLARLRPNDEARDLSLTLQQTRRKALEAEAVLQAP